MTRLSRACTWLARGLTSCSWRPATAACSHRSYALLLCACCCSADEQALAVALGRGPSCPCLLPTRLRCSLTVLMKLPASAGEDCTAAVPSVAHSLRMALRLRGGSVSAAATRHAQLQCHPRQYE